MREFDTMKITFYYEGGSTRQTITSYKLDGKCFNVREEMDKVHEKMKERWAHFDSYDNGELVGSLSIHTKDVDYYYINFESKKEKQDLIDMNKKLDEEFEKAKDNLSDKISFLKFLKIK